MKSTVIQVSSGQISGQNAQAAKALPMMQSCWVVSAAYLWTIYGKPLPNAAFAPCSGGALMSRYSSKLLQC